MRAPEDGRGGKPIVVVDIDGTVADVGHRLRYVHGRRRDWNRFFAAMGADRPIAPAIERVRRLASEHEIVLVTGRPEAYRDVTERWLREHGIPHTRLLMRGEGDRRPDYVAKADLVRGLAVERIAFAIDDRAPVCDAYRALGIRCYGVEGDGAGDEVNERYREAST